MATAFRTRRLQVGAVREVTGGVADVEYDKIPAGDGVVDKIGVAENGRDVDVGDVGRTADLREVCERSDCLFYPLSHALRAAGIALREVGADRIKVGNGARSR